MKRTAIALSVALGLSVLPAHASAFKKVRAVVLFPVRLVVAPIVYATIGGAVGSALGLGHAAVRTYEDWTGHSIMEPTP